MPAPNPSNRERLLRLIDGGTEALKEMQPDETPAKPAGPAVQPAAKKAAPNWAAARLVLDAWRLKLPRLSGTEQMRFGKWLIVLAALIAGLHYGLEMIKTMKPSTNTLASADISKAAVTEEDESGVGLRLVGVDSSDASPVALLEDIKTGKTYFARANEKVGGARVKQVQKNKVVVSYRGKNVELR